MWLAKATRWLSRVVEPVSKFWHYVGAGILAAMMFLTAADVALRYFFNRPIMGSYELTGFMMALIISFSLAYCGVKKGHVIVDLAISHFPQRTQAIIGSITCLFSLVLLSLITWQGAIYAKLQFYSHYSSTVLMIPFFPFVGAVAFGIGIFCLVILRDFFDFLSQAAKK